MKKTVLLLIAALLALVPLMAEEAAAEDVAIVAEDVAEEVTITETAVDGLVEGVDYIVLEDGTIVYLPLVQEGEAEAETEAVAE